MQLLIHLSIYLIYIFLIYTYIRAHSLIQFIMASVPPPKSKQASKAFFHIHIHIHINQLSCRALRCPTLLLLISVTWFFFLDGELGFGRRRRVGIYEWFGGYVLYVWCGVWVGMWVGCRFYMLYVICVAGVQICYVMVWYGMIWYAMLCYVMLCYAMVG